MGREICVTRLFALRVAGVRSSSSGAQRMSRPEVARESVEDSVQALGELLAEADTDEGIRQLMAQDLVSKVASMPENEGWVDVVKALSHYAPQEVQQSLRVALRGRPDGSKQRFAGAQGSAEPATAPPAASRVHPKHADVGIVTVLTEELEAVMSALRIRRGAREDERSRGLRFWEKNLRQPRTGVDLRVVVTKVDSTPLRCAFGCSTFYRRYELGCSLLVGIAAGRKDKMNLGDVVVSEMVLDYEGERRTPKGGRKRPWPYSVDTALSRDLAYFDSPNIKRRWKVLMASRLKNYRSRHVVLPGRDEDRVAKCDIGVILAGNKLLDDGSLPRLAKKYHDKVLAAEMEGSGFAGMSREAEIPWLVFRGISDFGGPNESRLRAKWKNRAALAAATSAVTFLEHSYCVDEEPSF